MEMEYRDTSRRGKIIIALGVVLALGAGAAAFFLINQAQEQAGQAGLQKVSVVVARLTIPARKPIEEGDVEVRLVPLDPTNAQGIVSTTDKVVGRVSSVTILEGQLVTTNLLASTASGGQFTILGPAETVAPDSEAWRAVSITVTDEQAVGGLLLPNQTVDVFVTATVNVPQEVLDAGRYYTDRTTKITYQDMLILAKSGTFYIMKASLAVAEEIAHLQASGSASFSLALRPDQDVRMADSSKLGATTNMLIKRYGLPVPEIFPPGRGPIPTAAPTAAPSPSASAAPAAAVASPKP
ncbi:MAG TPA: Flp pilus assembly protein CpaB [Candidatus Limnocylindrales bacterium]|nr:Flp pilus assembly protein CpaB [Candidatus Limnocylindrales bacterium]